MNPIIYASYKLAPWTIYVVCTSYKLAPQMMNILYLSVTLAPSTDDGRHVSCERVTWTRNANRRCFARVGRRRGRDRIDLSAQNKTAACHRTSTSCGGEMTSANRRSRLKPFNAQRSRRPALTDQCVTGPAGVENVGFARRFGDCRGESFLKESLLDTCADATLPETASMQG